MEIKDFEGLVVTHKTRGKGNIVKIDHNNFNDSYSLIVQFINGTNMKMIFPDAFKEFLTIENEEANNLIQYLLEQKYKKEIEKNEQILQRHLLEKEKRKKLLYEEKRQKKLIKQRKKRQQYIDNYSSLFENHKDLYDFTIRYITQFEENETYSGAFQIAHMYGKQQDILDVFYLDYIARHSAYDIDSDYCVIFLNITTDINNRWRNYLDNNGNVLYEEHISDNEDFLIIDEYRAKNRITFMKNSEIPGHDHGYVYIGTFKLDSDYNYKNDFDSKEPRLKYNKILDDISYKNNCIISV